MMKQMSFLIALAAVALVLANPTQAQDAAGHSMDHAMPMAGQGAAGAFQRGMAEMGEAMQAVPATGNPDRDFAQMMIVHHQGAIDMAKTELEYGKDPEMRKLAEEVIAAQEKEIAFMKAWLAQQSE